MAPKKDEPIEIVVARIDERSRADRIAFTVYSAHIKDELTDIKNMLRNHIADEETQRLQFSFMVNKITDHNKLIEETGERSKKYWIELKTDFQRYRQKMKLWEIFQDWKKVPFWTFMAIFAIVAREEIKLLISSIISKFTGQ